MEIAPATDAQNKELQAKDYFVAVSLRTGAVLPISSSSRQVSHYCSWL